MISLLENVEREIYCYCRRKCEPGPKCSWVTCNVEYHVLVARSGAGQVAAVDASIVTTSSTNDEHRQRTVVRSVDAISPVINRHVFAWRYAYRPAVLGAGARWLFLHPVNLSPSYTRNHSTYLLTSDYGRDETSCRRAEFVNSSQHPYPSIYSYIRRWQIATKYNGKAEIRT